MTQYELCLGKDQAELTDVCIYNNGFLYKRSTDTLYFLDGRVDGGVARDMSEELTATKNMHSNSFPPIEEECYYGGILYPHYGHFILESLSRMSHYEKGIPIIWATVQRELMEYQKEIFSLLLPEDTEHILVSNIGFVERLIVRQRGYIITDRFSCQHMRFLSKVGRRVGECKELRGKKVWLSRIGYRTWSGEQRLQEEIRKLGWIIIRPEYFSIRMQLQLFSEAAVIVGVKGSAMHSVVFTKPGACKLVLLERFERNGLERLMDNFELIEATRRDGARFLEINGYHATSNEELSRIKGILEDLF